MTILRRTMPIVNQRGLHARASRKLAELALAYEATIRVCRDDDEADATSLMDLMMLGAGLGCDIEIIIEGPQAAEAMEAISRLVSDGFGENE